MSSLIACYADEEVDVGEKRGLSCPLSPIEMQMRTIQQLFQELEFDRSIPECSPRPSGSEGWLLIPRWEKFAPTYNDAVVRVVTKLKDIHPKRFYNYCGGGLGPKYLWEHEHTVAALRRVSALQPSGDVLVVPAQLGSRYHGCSARRARAVYSASEFGLGVFAVSIALLTHPGRLASSSDLRIACIGDEYPVDRPNTDGTMFFGYTGSLVLGSVRCHTADCNIGHATGFVPET